jgi:hypothetical protein
MKLLALIPAILLTGCLVTPVKQKFPEVPKELMVACPDLNEVQPTTKLSDVITVVSKNYSEYHECRIKVDIWIEWYTTQREIFNK